MIKKKFKTPLYGTKFTCIIYEDANEPQSYFKDLDTNTRFADFDGCVFWHKDHLYVAFQRLKKGYPTPGIIAHEAKHLVNNIFINIGHEPDKWHDEPECYLLMWIVNRIHEFINKHE